VGVAAFPQVDLDGRGAPVAAFAADDDEIQRVAAEHAFLGQAPSILRLRA